MKKNERNDIFIKSYLKRYTFIALFYISLYLCIIFLITNLFIGL